MFETIQEIVHEPQSRCQAKTRLVTSETPDKMGAPRNNLINNSFTGSGPGEHQTSQQSYTGREPGENEQAIQGMNEEEPASPVGEEVPDNEPIENQLQKWTR